MGEMRKFRFGNADGLFVKVPLKYNVGVTKDSFIVGNTNYDAQWDEFKIKLPEPKGKWVVYTMLDYWVILIDECFPAFAKKEEGA